MTFVRCLAVAFGLGLLAGCSSQNTGVVADAEVTVLQEVNDLLHASAGTSNRVPANVAALHRHENLYPRAAAALKSGDVVVLWGAQLKGEGQVGQGEAVVAYEKKVPTEGGYVLLSAGTVKKMTAAEFNAAPKAGKK